MQAAGGSQDSKNRYIYIYTHIYIYTYVSILQLYIPPVHFLGCFHFGSAKTAWFSLCTRNKFPDGCAISWSTLPQICMATLQLAKLEPRGRTRGGSRGVPGDLKWAVMKRLMAPKQLLEGQEFGMLGGRFRGPEKSPKTPKPTTPSTFAAKNGARFVKLLRAPSPKSPKPSGRTILETKGSLGRVFVTSTSFEKMDNCCAGSSPVPTQHLSSGLFISPYLMFG